MGFELHGDKFDLGKEVTFLGLLGSFPSTSNGGRLHISLPPVKRKNWSELITSYLKEGRVSHRCLEKLVGRLSFSQTTLFGEFARTQLRPLRRKLHRRVYSAVLSPYERSILEWWASIIAEFAPRLDSPRPLKPDWIIYTDAASTPARICALLFYGNRTSPDLHSCFSSGVDVAWHYLFRHTNLIYGLELLALVLFFEETAPRLQGSCCWVYLDNNNCLAALIRGDSNTEIIAVLVARFWRTVQRHDIFVWFSRAKSTLNPADLPARAKILSFRARYKRTFASSKGLFAVCRANLRKLTVPPRRPPLAVREIQKGAQRPNLT